LRDGDRSFTELSQFALQCIVPILHIHSNSFVHRDIAARNYLVSIDNKIKLSDFGLAKQISEENYYGNADNNLPIRWCSPEVINKRKFSTKSDVWAYGIVCFEIFSEGITPYNDMDNKECIQRIGKEYFHPEKPDKCTEEFWKLVVPCFNKIDTRPDIDLLYSPIEKFVNPHTNETTDEIEKKPTEVIYENESEVIKGENSKIIYENESNFKDENSYEKSNI